MSTEPNAPDAAILRHFAWGHLPPGLAAISERVANVAYDMVEQLDGPELTAGLRKLLEAKDCFVRAALPKDRATEGSQPMAAEQLRDGAVERVEAFLGDWPNGDVMWFANAGGVAPLTVTDLRAVVAQRVALAARVAELDAERDDDLCVMAAFLLPNRRPIEHWLAILANHFGSRAQELTQDPERFAAARFRVDHVPADTTPTTNDLES